MAQIKALSELLVETGMFGSTRNAIMAINKGQIYVAGVRVANKAALLVIVHNTVIEYRYDGLIKRIEIGPDGRQVIPL